MYFSLGTRLVANKNGGGGGLGEYRKKLEGEIVWHVNTND